MGSSEIGFRMERIIKVEGPFQQAQKYVEARSARATVEIQGETNSVEVVISGEDELGLPGMQESKEREEARMWFALVDLAHRSSRDLARKDPRTLPEIRLPIPRSGLGFKSGWSIEAVRQYAQKELRGYEVTRDGQTWKARSKT